MNVPARPRRLAFWGLIVLIAAGRLAVAFADHRSLIAQDIVQDDAFYYFKIAAHLVDGDGLTFDGTTPTSGFQPLWLLLLAPVVASAKGDVVTPIRLALTLLALVAALGGAVLYGWVRRGAGLAALALFAVSPYFLFLGVNGLETGLAILFALALCRAYGPAFGPAASPSPARVATFGALCGLAFLARVDLALLLLALALTALVDHGRARTLPLALRRAALAGGVALVVWLPWGVTSRLATGDWFPASGAASRQIALNYGWSNLTPIWGDPTARVFDPDDPPAAFHADVAATQVTAFLLEHPLLGPLRANAGFTIWPQYPRFFPYRALRRAPNVTAVVVVALLIALVLGLRRLRRTDRAAGAARPSWGVMLTTWFVLQGLGYAVYCPAHWYLTRYQAPAVAVTLALGTAFAWRRFGSKASIAVFALLFLTQLSLYRGETAAGLRWSDATPGRFLAGWISVAPHLDPGKRLGAFQAGTFAWFGRRDVINLDGKVNPDAARALREKRLDAYIADRGIEQIVDWPWIVDTLCLRHAAEPRVRLHPRFGEPGNYGFVVFDVEETR